VAVRQGNIVFGADAFWSHRLRTRSILSDNVRQSRELVRQLHDSEIYKDYEKAFRETTGLPINLRPIEAFNLPHHTDPNENPFGALLAKTYQSCSACLQLQRRVEEEARMEFPRTLKGVLPAWCDSACPGAGGGEPRGFSGKPARSCFTGPARRISRNSPGNWINWGVDTDLKRLEEADFQSRVLEKKQYEAVLRLLTIFAQHLSSLSN